MTLLHYASLNFVLLILVGVSLSCSTGKETKLSAYDTPKGCTIVGLNEMEHNGFSSALIKGIIKSHDAIEA